MHFWEDVRFRLGFVQHLASIIHPSLVVGERQAGSAFDRSLFPLHLHLHK